MQSGDAHIIEPDDLVSQKLGGEGCFLRHGHIAGASGGNHDGPQAAGGCHGSGNGDMGVIVVGDGGEGIHLGCLFCIQAGDQYVFLPVIFQGPEDSGNLLCRLSGTVNNLRCALPHLPVKIHLGIADVFVGLILEAEHGVLYGHRSRLHGFQKRFDFTAHFRSSRSSSTEAYRFFSCPVISFRCFSSSGKSRAFSCSLASFPKVRTRKSVKPKPDR